MRVERFASLYDSIAVKAPGNDAESIKTLRRFFDELEGIRGKPASERTMMTLTYAGLIFILALMIFVIGLDIFRLFT